MPRQRINNGVIGARSVLPPNIPQGVVSMAYMQLYNSKLMIQIWAWGAGGGGGSGYVAPSIVQGVLSQGYQTTAGDSINALRGSYGDAGAVASTGTQGVVIIQYYGPQRGTGGTITTVGGDTRHTFTTVGGSSLTLTF